MNILSWYLFRQTWDRYQLAGKALWVVNARTLPTAVAVVTVAEAAETVKAAEAVDIFKAVKAARSARIAMATWTASM